MTAIRPAWPARALLSLASPAGARARLPILTYHRVLQHADPLLPGEPDVAAFAAQMSVLAATCSVLPLPEAVERLAVGALQARSVCITFDDGYANNFEYAAPVLRKLGMTATIFVTQHPVEAGIMWNDLVIEAVRRAPANADLSDLGLGQFTLNGWAERRSAIDTLLAGLKYRSVDERWRTANEIYHRFVGALPPRLMLRDEQVAAMARGLFDIGAHTVRHPILKSLAPAAARREIEAGADWLAAVTGRRPASFAYPNGVPGRDFDATHAAMVRDAGFRLAVSTAWGSATRSSDFFALPRVSLLSNRRADVAWQLLKICLTPYRN